MLLDRLIELTPEDHADRASLIKANTWITGVAKHLNKSLTQQEEQLQLVKLQSCMFPRVSTTLCIIGLKKVIISERCGTMLVPQQPTPSTPPPP